MQNDQMEYIRPFARMLANEVSSEEAALKAKKGLFHSLPSGPNILTDIPDANFNN